MQWGGNLTWVVDSKQSECILNHNEYRFIYGPVPSRRFGRSLGVDIISAKTCSYNCVFCHVGYTRDLTLERREYAPVNEVVKELDKWLKTGNSADFITLSGMGEPTLHSRFGDILDSIRKMCSIKTALLSNGSLFYMPEVRSAACKADVVKLSLSAWDQKSFESINHPHHELKLDQIVEGMKTFRSEYNGQLWLEIIVVLSLNSLDDSMKKIAGFANTIKADKIHLNTVVRPPSEHNIMPVSEKVLKGFSRLFHPEAEVIAEFRSDLSCGYEVSDKEILKMISIRPCTADDITKASNLNAIETGKRIAELKKPKMIVENKHLGKVYYRINEIKE